MPKTRLWTLLLAAGAVLGLPLAAPASGSQPNEQRATSTMPATAGAAATHAHSTEAMPAGLRPALYGALAKDSGPAYDINKDGCATLPKQKLTACFGTGGAHFTGATTPLALHLVAWGRLPAGETEANGLTPIKAVKPTIKGNEASYAHGDLTEWWRVLPVGFEQGFTITKRPGGKGELTLELAASQHTTSPSAPRHSGAAPASAKASGGNPVKTSPSIPLRSEGGRELAWGKLRYGDLVVTDAKGRVVPASLKYEGNRILIVVNDDHAVYPLTVDPLLWLQQKAIANDGAAGDTFGFAVALSGTTAIVATPFASVNGNDYQGAAYVFTDSNGVWEQTQRLTANDGEQNDYFGYSVAIGDTTALVGAPHAAVGGNAQQGAVYVFQQSGANWTQAAKLTANDGAAYDNLGWAVALSGTTALAGAPYATVNGHGYQGAAYVFVQTGGGWTQTQKLTASDGAASDELAATVALDGATALLGAPYASIGANGYQGTVYVFTKANGTWTQAQKLAASDGAWGDEFGSAVSVCDSHAFVGAEVATVNGQYGQGAAYVFTNSGGNWTQIQKLVANDGAADDGFGWAVACNGTSALIGAVGTSVGAGAGQGAAYLFADSNGTWTQSRELTASDGASGDGLGNSVAFSGTTALAGAEYAGVNGNGSQGAAYFFGAGNLDLVMSAPATVGQGENYTSQTMATNDASVASPAVSATIAIPAAATFISASATQGSCSETAGVVTCDFGSIGGNAGTATANVTLKATGSPGTTIENIAGIAKATPALTAGAPTQITNDGSCPEGYTEYDSHVNAGKLAMLHSYQAPAGEENAILTAPAGFQLYVRFQNAQGQKTYRIPGHEVHRRTPAGAFTWAVKAGNAGSAYTFCLLHP